MVKSKDHCQRGGIWIRACWSQRIKPRKVIEITIYAMESARPLKSMTQTQIPMNHPKNLVHQEIQNLITL